MAMTGTARPPGIRRSGQESPLEKERVRSDGEELFDGIVAEFGHGAGGADRSALKDGEVITELAAEIQILLDEQYRHFSLLAEHPDRIPDLVDDVWLDAFGGFIKNEELGLCEERAADGELLLLPAGEHASLAIQELLYDGEKRVNAVNLLLILFHAPRFQSDEEILLYGEVWKDVAALGDITEACARSDCGGHRVHRRSAKMDTARIERQQTHQRLERGAFPNTVPAHEAEHRFLTYGKRHPAKDRAASDGNAHVVED